MDLSCARDQSEKHLKFLVQRRGLARVPKILGGDVSLQSLNKRETSRFERGLHVLMRTSANRLM